MHHSHGSSRHDAPQSLEAGGRAQTRARARRFRGLTCAACRARKVRCDGAQPGCKMCDVYGVPCTYDKLPPMSQVLSLSRQLQDAEAQIAELRQAQTQSQTQTRSQVQSWRGSVMSDSAAIPGLSSTEPRSEPARTLPLPQTLSLDDQGKIAYYGPTSAVHEPADHGAPLTLARSIPAPAMWDEFALNNAARRTGIPVTVLSTLLHIHWVWVSPMFSWVYRPAFMRDMVTGGRYYSELLLVALCAHSAKYHDEQYVQLLQPRLHALLGEAILQPSSIPTVQALLQLSAREVAQGTLSQAWLYSGMAFRIADDLVLQPRALDVASIPGVSDIDVQVRKRLAWSCYFWDKAISLYTGRVPTLTEAPSVSALDSMDDSEDLDSWTPYIALISTSAQQSSWSAGYVVSAFANACRLSIIINDVIQQLYSPHHEPLSNTTIQGLQRRLDQWRSATPSHLKVEPSGLVSSCPPSYILCQNVLFYTTIILAHRPFSSRPAHNDTCVRAAMDIEKLILLYESTYSFDNITYLMGYCIYTGASVLVKQTRSQQDGDTSTDIIKTFLRALSIGSRRCPILAQSLNIIFKSVGQGVSQNSSADNFTLSEGAIPPLYNMPAFPQLDGMMLRTSAAQSPLGFGSMSFLDCYPELQLDLDQFPVTSSTT